MDWGDIIAIAALAVGMYGAGLSTYKLIAETKKGKPRLGFKIWPIPMPGKIEPSQNPGDYAIGLCVTNVGNVQVSLIRGMLLVIQGTYKGFVEIGKDENADFPGKLEPGDCFHWGSSPIPELMEYLWNMGVSGRVQIAGGCLDLAGNYYWGTPQATFDVDSWRKLSQGRDWHIAIKTLSEPD